MNRQFSRIATASAVMLLLVVSVVGQPAAPDRPRTPAEARAAKLAEQRQKLEAELVLALPQLDELIASGKPEDRFISKSLQPRITPMGGNQAEEAQKGVRPECHLLKPQVLRTAAFGAVHGGAVSSGRIPSSFV